MFPYNIRGIDLNAGDKISTPDITSSKPKVVRVTYKNIPIRVKINKNGAIGCRDTNECFIKAFFPDFYQEYVDEQESLRGVISELRIRMELRSLLIEMAFNEPRAVLKHLLEEDAR